MIRSLLRRRVRGGASSGAVGSADRPAWDVPTFLDWNPATRLHDLKPAKAAELPYAAALPHATGTTPTFGANPVTNMAILNAAIQAARDASGTAAVRQLARIRVDHTRRYSGVLDIGNVNLTDHTGAPVRLIIETTALASLRQEGERAAFGDGMFMPQLGMNSFNQSTVRYDWNTRRVRLVGLWLTIDPDVAAALIANPAVMPGTSGDATGVPFSYWGVFGPRHEDSPPNLFDEAEDVILDRCLVTVPDGVNMRNGVLANIAKFACLDSWIENRGDINWIDNSAIRVTATTGGEWICRNSLIAGARGEWAFTGGGGQIFSAQRVPNDVWFRDCHFTSFTRWLDAGHLSKNAWEGKCGWRQLMEACLITNCWTAGNLLNQRHTVIWKCEDNSLNLATEEPFQFARDIQMHAVVMRNCTGSIGVLEGGHFGDTPWSQTSRIGFEAIKRVSFTHVVCEPMNWTAFNAAVPTSAEKWDRFGVYLAAGSAREADAVGGVPVDYYEITQVNMQHCSWGNAMNVEPGGRKYVPTLNINGNTAALRNWSIGNNAFYSDYVQPDDAPFQLSINGAFTAPATGWPVLLARSGSVVDFRNNAMGTVANPASMWTTPTGPSNIARTDNNFGQDTTSLRPLPGSQLIGAGFDGGNIGADFALLDAALARVATGRN